MALTAGTPWYFTVGLSGGITLAYLLSVLLGEVGVARLSPASPESSSSRPSITTMATLSTPPRMVGQRRFSVRVGSRAAMSGRSLSITPAGTLVAFAVKTLNFLCTHSA